MLSLSDFHYQLVGPEKNRKLLFLHGLLGSAANWRRITKSFSDQFQVLTYDQRGHGRSVQPQSGYSPQDYSADLAMILHELGWQKITLVGHSMGGRNALQFAVDHPEKVEQLVIEDIGPDGNNQALAKMRHLLELVPTPFASKAAARDFFLHRYAQKVISDHPQAKVLAQYFYTNIVECPDGSTDWRFYLPGIYESIEKGRDRDRWELIDELRVPTLVIRGEYSDELSREVFEHMLARNTQYIQGVEIRDSGHWVHFDQPEAFVAALQRFFGN